MLAIVSAHISLVAQTRPSLPPRPAPSASGGGSQATDRFISAVVYASWLQHWRASDGYTRSLLVLWRGTPGWFVKTAPGGGRSSSGGGSGSGGWQTFTAGGSSFELQYDFDRNVVTLLNQEVSLVESNVVFVDFVDSPDGAQIVHRLWIETRSDQQPPMPDPIFAIVKSSPRLYEYVRCDVTLPNATAYISEVMSIRTSVDTGRGALNVHAHRLTRGRGRRIPDLGTRRPPRCLSNERRPPRAGRGRQQPERTDCGNVPIRFPGLDKLPTVRRSY